MTRPFIHYFEADKPMRLLLCTFLIGFCWTCEKKPTADELKAIETEFDYRTALESYKVGINHLNNKEIQDGIKSLIAAVKLDDNNFRYHRDLGLAYSMNGQWEEAEAELKTTLAINPKDSEALNLLGSLYCSLDRFDEGIDALRRVILDKAYSQPKFAYLNLGICKRAQGRTEEAIAAFKLATQFDPEFYRAFIFLGNIYQEKKDYNNMLLHYQKAEPGFPNNVEVLFKIGFASFKLKRFDQAKGYLAQVTILFPSHDIDKPTQDMLRYIEKFQRNSRN